MKIKVCGMKYPENIVEVAALLPDYMGFIFYNKSPRNFEDTIPDLPVGIKKTGVFVNTPIHEVLATISKHQLDAVQLHGNESVGYCAELYLSGVDVEVFKVFSVLDTFDLSLLANFEPYVDYFLFDTKGKEKGGNGFVFDWSVLQHYPSNKPFILSGGIGIDELAAVKEIMHTNLPIYMLDVNSKFEISPGLKNTEVLEKFVKEIKEL